MRKLQIKFILLILVMLVQSCATVKNVHTDQPAPRPSPTAEVPIAVQMPAKPPAEASTEVVDEDSKMKFSDLNNWTPVTDRQYKRMTRQRMEDESELNSSAGSLWKMDGQTSYLFAENKQRRPGDPTSIKMEGPALKQIEMKVGVIQDLLKKLEEQKLKAEEDVQKAEEEKRRLALLEEEKKLRAEKIAKGEILIDPMADTYPPEPERKPASDVTEKTKAEAKTEAKKEVEVKEEKVDLKEVDLIPSQIVEKTVEGLYRIRGQQFLTIKKKPYKVLATALVRPEDFSDAGVSSSKLIEPQFDVVHVKKAVQ